MRAPRGRRRATASRAAAALTLTGAALLAGAPAAQAGVEVRPRAVELPGTVRVAADCPVTGQEFTSANVTVPALGRLLVVHVDEGRVRTSIELGAPDEPVEAMEVRVACRTADGERAPAGSGRVRVEPVAEPVAAPVVQEVAASADDEVSAVLPVATFGVVSLCAFVAFGLLNRRGDRDAGSDGQRPARDRRARR